VNFYEIRKDGPPRKLKHIKGETAKDASQRTAGMTTKRPVKYAHLVEKGHWSAAGQGKSFTDGTLGTSIRRRTFPVRSFTKGKPFLAPAFDAGLPLVKRRLAEAAGEAIKREMSKL
jgi:hypothetical protein